MTVNIGDEAPDFDLPTYSDTRLSLRSLRGKNVVLYFYPKDMTPGCTTEARDFRDLADAFHLDFYQYLAATGVGVSALMMLVAAILTVFSCRFVKQTLDDFRKFLKEKSEEVRKYFLMYLFFSMFFYHFIALAPDWFHLDV